MCDSRGKASAWWGYAAVCQPLPANIYEAKYITRTLNETIKNSHTSAGIRRIAVRLMLALYDPNVLNTMNITTPWQQV